jgi:hypothetical protein
MAKAKSVRSTPPRNAPEIHHSNIVRLKDYRPAPPKRVKQKSQYELYPLPFFNGKERCTWDVKPTGNYSSDLDIGRAFGIEFLKSCNGTCGWATLPGQIVGDMIRAGTGGQFPDGQSKVDGIVTGFMSVIGDALAVVYGAGAQS